MTQAFRDAIDMHHRALCPNCPDCNPATPLRWVVAFTDVDGRSNLARRLLSRFKAGFRHCFAFRETEGGILLVQLTTARLQVEFFPGETEADRIRCTLEACPTATFVEAHNDVNEDSWTPRGVTCTSVVRALVAMPSRFQTPYQLAKELRRINGRRRTEEKAGDERGA